MKKDLKITNHCLRSQKLNIKYKKGKNLKNYIVKDDLIIVRTM